MSIEKLVKVETVSVDARKLSGSNELVEVAQKLLDAKKITAKQFEEIFNSAIAAQEKLNDAIESSKTKVTDLGSFLKSNLRSLFSFDDFDPEAEALKQAQKNLAAGKITQEAFDKINEGLQASIEKKKALQELFAQTISQAFDTARSAMDSFFDAERNRIEHSNQVVQKRLDLELQQAKDRAQSKAEEDSLDRQFAAKKEAANREAFEKNKKLQIQQAKINLAIQLSNLAVIAFSPNPLNIATLGIAGAIQYAIQAALALANYALNVGRINSAQFAGGGKVKPEDLANGKITARPNIPEQSNGDNILATVRVGEVILNKRQQELLGGPKTFRAIGVPGFASGGATNIKLTNWEIENELKYHDKIRAFASGGFTGLGDFPLGDNLKAPINPQSFLNPSSANTAELKKIAAENTSDLKNVMTAINQQTENLNSFSRSVNQRIDKLKVVLDPHAVQKANDQKAKSTAIGTL